MRLPPPHPLAMQRLTLEADLQKVAQLHELVKAGIVALTAAAHGGDIERIALTALNALPPADAFCAALANLFAEAEALSATLHDEALMAN